MMVLYKLVCKVCGRHFKSDAPKSKSRCPECHSPRVDYIERW